MKKRKLQWFGQRQERPEREKHQLDQDCWSDQKQRGMKKSC